VVHRIDAVGRDIHLKERTIRAELKNTFDGDTAQAWLANTVIPNPMLWLTVRSSDGFLIAFLKSVPWLPDVKTCSVITVCCDFGKVWQALPLLRASLAWAKHRGAASWEYESDTGIEIGPLVRRLGAATKEPRYVIDLET